MATATPYRRLPPLLHNLHGYGQSWKENGIPAEEVLSLNGSIKHGSTAVWKVLASKLENAFAKGLLE
jgi:putative hydrolase of HD superfamily